MKALFIPVNTEYFEAFKNGSKKIEWRIFGKRWNERVCLQGRNVVISKGYGKKDRLNGVLEGFSKHVIDDPGHIFITNGQIQFLGDCTHALAGQTVPLPKLPGAE